MKEKYEFDKDRKILYINNNRQIMDIIQRKHIPTTSEEKTFKMNSKFFSILVSILYFSGATIAEQPSTTSPSDNSSGASELYCLGGYNENRKSTFSVSKLNTKNNHWESATEMPTPKHWFGATTIGKKIYVCGGWTGNTERINLLEAYDCEKNTWTELAPMSDPRSSIGMTTLNNQIYISGGSSIFVFSSVSKYSPETNTWAVVKEMNEARYGHVLITLHGTIYAISGYNSKTVERYTPLNDKWTYVESTKYEHFHFGATSHQNKIYILSEKGFEVYDPESNTWDELPSLTIGDGVQLVSMNDKLLAVGVGAGKSKGKVSKSVYEFDTKNESWIHLPDMNTPRQHHRAVVVNF